MLIVNGIAGLLACLSLALLFWQWLAARQFPLHERAPETPFTPPVTMLKSLKGCDPETEACLRSWFVQAYDGPVQILFGVAAADDPACAVAEKLMREFPAIDSRLVVCPVLIGANSKVSKLVELEKLAAHEIIVVSDADVRVPPDFLANAVQSLNSPETGLVNCFYRLANPSRVAMQWEAIAINADFWSQVLQAKSLKPLDFALGAVMISRRKTLGEIGGFVALADCLADDYQLGNRIAKRGHRIVLSPVVAECWDPPMTWAAVWKHQLRWARTIRVSQPLPYFFSILSNAGFWAVVWLAIELCTWRTRTVTFEVGQEHYVALLHPGFPIRMVLALVCIGLRILIAFDLQRRMTQSCRHAIYGWLVPVKDLLQAALWVAAFGGNSIEWRGRKFRLRHDGTLAAGGRIRGDSR
jgi:ceramide glucosyltransferase